ncbi:MAG TPA: glutathione S-transferase family protein [Nodularia sp. (in: cyanobacteria)]|nr:glutathione S-transferase family protein [Nodularia sp. (in: cyanobacteria)]
MNTSLLSQEKPLRLITIPVSHYSEKVRWALKKLQISYVEEPHMPPFHRFATTRVGGKSTPVLITPTNAFTDSTDILRYLDKIAPSNAKLYPSDINLRREVEKLEDLFNQHLGPATRRWGYFYLMNNYKEIQRIWCQGVPFMERILFPVVFPVMRKVVQQTFDITPESSVQAYQEIQRIFAKISELLADGRTYLVGNNFSAADITFAALAAPVLQPPQHPIKRQNLQELPPKMVAEINFFRETLAGAFALRLYRDR